jgi:hypothetical protein
MGRVEGPRREAVAAMLVGLYKRAGVDRVYCPEPRMIAGTPVEWTRWAEWWERDQAEEQRPALMPDINLLPVGRT